MKIPDEMGDKLKALEGVEAKRFAQKGKVLLARLDGRAFHTFTKGLPRPFDDRLSNLMIEVTKRLVQELNANIGYTQSDEISLVWYQAENSESDYPFGGRFQKLCSILSACATGNFVQLLPAYIPEKGTQMPLFDCRVWTVDDPSDAFNTFIWREHDARKNAVSMAASAYFPHKELDGVHTQKRIEMLSAIGIDFHSMPRFFKCGTYVARDSVTRFMTDEELANVPAEFRDTAAAHPMVRTVIKETDFTSLTQLKHPLGLMMGLKLSECR